MPDTTHPHPARVVFTAWLVVAAWCVLGLIIVLVCLAQFQGLRSAWPFQPAVFVSLFSVLVGLGIVYLGFAIAVRCPSCARRLFVELPGRKHLSASRIWGMDHWASSVVDVLRQGHCTCMYCGSVTRVRN